MGEQLPVIGVSGRFLTKTQRLEWLQNNVKILATVEPSELKVRGYGDVVVVTGLLTIQGGAEEPTVYERFTHVWVKRGRWQMVAGQTTAAAHVRIKKHDLGITRTLNWNVNPAILQRSQNVRFR